MKIVIADDHVLLTDALTEYLIDRDRTMEVAQVANLTDAIERIRDTGPMDLAILDLNMPGMNGLQGLTTVREQFPELPVVIMTGSPNRRQMQEALERGAAGFITKSMSGRALIKALELILAGERFVPSSLVHGPADAGDQPDTGGRHALPDAFPDLTDRERQVLSMVIDGRSNKSIAEAVELKEITVAFHLRKLFAKFGVSNRTHLVARAMNLGWGKTHGAA